MSGDPVAVIPPYEECRKLWLPAADERWHAHWIDDGPKDRLAFWCPACAQRDCQVG
jgi:hypothetical protein